MVWQPQARLGTGLSHPGGTHSNAPRAEGKENGKEGASPWNQGLWFVRIVLGFVSPHLGSQKHLFHAQTQSVGQGEQAGE